LLGPLPPTLRRPNNWITTDLTQVLDLGKAATQLRFGRASEFYRRLATEPAGSLTLIEAPRTIRILSNPLAAYQGIHPQRVRMGSIEGFCLGPPGGGPDWSDRRLQLGSEVRATHDPADVARRGDLLVVHFLVANEVVGAAPEELRQLDLHPCLPWLPDSFGPPVFSDADLAVFDLRSASSRSQ
jgi:hypothetical protein